MEYVHRTFYLVKYQRSRKGAPQEVYRFETAAKLKVFLAGCHFSVYKYLTIDTIIAKEVEIYGSNRS